MLTIRAINPTGMFSFGWMPVIQLDKRGCVFLSGWNEDRGCSNGAGKSSVVNAIKEIAFSKNDTDKSGINVVNKHEDWDNGFFGVLWCTCRNNRSWRIMNIRKWKGKPPDGVDGPSQLLSLGSKYTGTDIFVEEWDGNQWLDRRPTASKDNKSLKDAQQFIIDEIFGMSYDQFSAYVCLGQKAESALVSGTPGAREKIIQSVTDVSLWTNAAAITKDIYTNKESELSQLQQQIYGRQQTLNAIQPPSQIEFDEAQRAIYFIEESYHKNVSALAEIESKLAEWEIKLNPNNASIDTELEILDAEERHIREAFENYRDPIIPEKITSHNNTIAHLTATNRADLIRCEHYNKLGVGQCSNCGQDVTKEHLDKELDRIVNEMNTRGELVNNMQDECNIWMKEYNKECEELRSKAKETMTNSLVALSSSRQKLIDKKSEYDSLYSTIQSLRDNKTYLESQISQKDMNLSIAKNNLAYLHRRNEDIEGIKTTIKFEQQKEKDLLSEINHLKWTERSLKKLRIQEYESALDRLNQIITERLYELWGPGLFARFVTSRNTTRGQSVVSQLDFVVDTSKKVGIPIEMYSGGERKIIIIATFLAMIQFANERGLGVNIAAIDEIDEHLDDVNTDKLVESFDAISGMVSTCLVISHNSRLLNTMNFDDKWTIHKANEMAIIKESFVN